MPSSRLTAAVLFSCAVSACASLPQTRCNSGERLAIHDSLYFGTDKPNGTVSSEDWSRFLEVVVTPRFPQGITASAASGQWRGADGVIVRESTHVLQLMHPDDVPSEQSVSEIVTAYKTQFQQEAVLRVKTRACISF